MDRGTEEPSNEINAEVAAEWEREYGEFDKSKLAVRFFFLTFSKKKI